MTKKNNYDGSNVKVLKGLEGIRQRFDMYVGSKETAALHLIKEAIDNGIDEYMNGFATFVSVKYDQRDNSIVVTDDGRGLPTDIHPTEKKPTMEVLFSLLHSSGKFDKDSFKISAGKNGVGVKAINALSEKLVVNSIREEDSKNIYYMEFSRGKTISKELNKIPNKTKLKHGSIIEFTPDKEILEDFININPTLIEENLEERSYCNGGLRLIFTLIDKKGKATTKEFYHENGIKDLVEKLNEDPYSSNLYYKYEEKGNIYEIALAYSNNTDEIIKSYVNGLVTSGGTHETGFKSGMTKSINEYIKKNNLLKKKDNFEIKGEDIRTGLVCVINLFLANATYKGQVKDQLSNPETNGIVSKKTNEEVTEFLLSNETQAKKICNRIIAFSKGRETANKYKDRIVNLNKSSFGLQFSGKFTDCISKDPTITELFICEGDSAEGNIKYSRIPQTQAIMPLRGKCKNSYSSSIIKLLENEEFKELVKIIFGTTDVKNINYDEDVRYHHICITCDADNDGFHIENLLLLFFWKHFPELIRRGYIYICLPPKYRTMVNNKFIYFKNDDELGEYLNTQIKNRIKIKTPSYIKLSELLQCKEEYIKEIDKLFSNFAISENVFNKIWKGEELGVDLKVIEQEDGDEIIQGIDEGNWNNFSVTELCEKYETFINSFDNKDMNNDFIVIEFDKKEIKVTILELFRLIDKISNISLDYFKGLGEASAEELFETTLNPLTRDLIQVMPKSDDEVEELLKNFYGKDSSKRKEIVRELMA